MSREMSYKPEAEKRFVVKVSDPGDKCGAGTTMMPKEQMLVAKKCGQHKPDQVF